jgi:hypothetical protein
MTLTRPAVLNIKIKLIFLFATFGILFLEKLFEQGSKGT